ncbi:hypothetical protein PIROE2DRAFT_1726 [Piromyces sp. E2]|nr:hypothetical protein PIROE2DRAFT_1726 [Piromyces sp. E2]|eukprot:OUM70299.1 hypothetical protein PIROE2DRAFT_1726 [Piromyces sp. E2]
MKKINRKLKIFLISLISIISAIIAVVGGYFIYLFASYERLEDNLKLDIVSKGNTNSTAFTNTMYSIMTYNIGFGAYEPDYSFFMDGGEYSWAKSEEGISPDILLVQEIDVDGTRTYHFNEVEDFQNNLGYGNYVFSQNYDSSFIFYPVTEPHGSNKSGILTCSSLKFKESLRRSLPISTSIKKFFDLDRCYSITRIAVNNGKELVVYNVHLSAYGSDEKIRESQLKMLTTDIQKDINNGNYVICGGDFNHNLRKNDNETNVPDWAQPFPREMLPEKSSFAFEVANMSFIEHNSCRNSDIPYEKGVTFTVLADGMLVSSNIEVDYYSSLDWEFVYSDHDPVYMKFKLKDQ